MISNGIFCYQLKPLLFLYSQFLLQLLLLSSEFKFFLPTFVRNSDLTKFIKLIFQKHLLLWLLLRKDHIEYILILKIISNTISIAIQYLSVNLLLYVLLLLLIIILHYAIFLKFHFSYSLETFVFVGRKTAHYDIFLFIVAIIDKFL